jgi:peptidoglycan/xylan/chitin deacetylase (PgdA/CDA1 family)
MRSLKDACLGLLFGIERFRDRPVQEILLYHSVGNTEPSAVTETDFRWQIANLKKTSDVVPLCDLKGRIAAMPHAKIAAVTFDDGRLDNFTVALPILMEFGIKATFFIVTGSIGGTYRGTGFQTPAMTKHQIREIASLGHEIGAHTETHPRLTDVALSRAREEMARSKMALEDLIGAPVVSFAYPFGQVSEDLRDCAREIGFSFAATTREGILPCAPDWFALPRVGVDSSVTRLQFRAKTSYAIETYEKLRGRRKFQGYSWGGTQS